LERSAETEPENPDVQHLLASAYVLRGDLQTALANYRRALTLEPDDPDALSNIATTLYYLGHWEEAVSYSQRASNVRPHPSTFDALGWSLAKLGRWHEAIEAFEKGVRLYNGSKSDSVMKFLDQRQAVRLDLADALAAIGRGETAISILDEITNSSNDSTDRGIWLAMLSRLLVKTSRTAEAARVAHTAVRVAPHLPVTHVALGWALLAADMHTEALESFRLAERLAAGDIEAEIGIAAALSMMGQHSSAIEAFQRLLVTTPDLFDRRGELRAMFEGSKRAAHHSG
jgi:tetratricopeptide (TPR) repeat protein